MNQSQFKDPVSHMCLAGTVVESWSLTQEMTGSNSFTLMTNIFFVTEFTEFSESHLGKTPTARQRVADSHTLIVQYSQMKINIRTQNDARFSHLTFIHAPLWLDCL